MTCARESDESAPNNGTLKLTEYAAKNIEKVPKSVITWVRTCTKLFFTEFCHRKYRLDYIQEDLEVTRYYLKSVVECCPGYSMENSSCSLKVSDDLTKIADETTTGVNVHVVFYVSAATGGSIVLIAVIVAIVCCTRRKLIRNAESETEMTNRQTPCLGKTIDKERYMELISTNESSHRYLYVDQPHCDSAVGGVNVFETENRYMAEVDTNNTEDVDSKLRKSEHIYDSVSDDE